MCIMYHHLANKINGHVGLFTPRTMHMLADYIDMDTDHFVSFRAQGRYMAFVSAGMRQYFVDPLGSKPRDHPRIYAALKDVYVDVDACLTLHGPLVRHSNVDTGYVTLYIVRRIFDQHPRSLSAAFVQRIGLDDIDLTSNVAIARDYFAL